MELHNFRYVRQNLSVNEFLRSEGRHRGGDQRQAPFKSSVSERAEPYKEQREQAPSYRRIEMNSTTFARTENEATQLLGAYDPELPASELGKSIHKVAIGKEDTKRQPRPVSASGPNVHSYDNLEQASSEIWSAGATIGNAPRPCSADAVNAAKALAKAEAKAANLAEQLALQSGSPRSRACSPQPGRKPSIVVDEDTGVTEIDAMRLEIGIRVWVPGGPAGGRGCTIAFVGQVRFSDEFRTRSIDRNMDFVLKTMVSS